MNRPFFGPVQKGIRTRSLTFARLVLFLTPALSAWAAVTGSIDGTLKDPSGGVIPNVKVTVTNKAQGVQTNAMTDARGVYTFPSLPVAHYDLKTESAGFKPQTRTDIAVDLDAVVHIDLTLELAEKATEVNVVENSVQIETESTQVGQVVSSQEITAVALNGRSYTDLLALQPGIVPVSTQQPDSVVMAGATVAINPSGTTNPGNQSISGQREDANGFMVNGADVKELMNGGTLIVPDLDSLAEFRVLTNNFDAQYGNYSGGIVNAVTKSGGNEFHGTGFEFLRNTSLDARNFFSPDRAFFRQNQYGGTVGGPIRKNKTFFFADFQGTRTTHGHDSGLLAVPTLSDRSGNLIDQASSLTGNVSGPYLADQLTQKLGYGVTTDEPYYTSNCTSSSQCVFPNAVIPQRAWSAPAQHLLQYIPAPNLGPATFSTGTQAEVVRDNKGSGRIDNNSDRWGTFSAYYFIDDYNLDEPYPTSQGGASVPGFDAQNFGRGQLYTVGYTKTFGATAVNDLRLSFMRSNNTVGQPHGGVGPSLASQGFQTGVGTSGIVPLDPSIEGVENVIFNSFVMGLPITNLQQVNNTYGLNDNYSKVFGNHTFKVGFQGSYEQVNVNSNPTYNGSFLFGGTETGLDFADFLIGVASNYNQADSQTFYLRHKYAGAYGQDSWRLRPNLTLNYGVRWELMQYWSEKFHQEPTFALGQQSQVFTTAPPGLVYPGDKGIPSTLVPQQNKFSPRIGIAWSPDSSNGFLHKLLGGTGNTSIRAGYGIFYSVIQGQVLGFDLPQPPYGLSYTSPGPPLFAEPFRTAANGSFTGNPFPLVFPSLKTSASNPNGSYDFSVFEPIAGATGPNPNNTYPYNENYFLSIERQLGKDTMLSLAYVGSQAHHLLLTYSVNPGNPALCLSLSTATSVAPGSATCGPFGEDSQYVSAAGQVYNGTRGPFGSFLSNDDFESSVGNSSYNSFQATLRHSGNGFSFLVGYTYSKSIDEASALGESVNPFDYQSHRSISAWDLRHNLVASYQYDLPVARLTKRIPMLTQGWSISGITRASSGFPVTIKSFDDNSLQGSIPNGVNNYSMDTADYNGQPLQLNGDPRNALPYFNPDAFTVSALGSAGNASRRSFYGPGEFNTDLALLKNFKISEKKGAQFRLEAFNVFNHAQFFGPAAVQGNIDSPLFGTVVKAADPRFVQLALKLTF
ncbi:MAG TPA: carboxypeptidase regulatory-like domain-containing protein [Bryobacteraceae bacterium]|nr:carboxypeptidase regulatory-like domain-containing protein [Bryobacteraceae bacterium]